MAGNGPTQSLYTIIQNFIAEVQIDDTTRSQFSLQDQPTSRQNQSHWVGLNLAYFSIHRQVLQFEPFQRVHSFEHYSFF